MKMGFDFIIKSISNESILNNKRIYLNLRHLYFSISRYNSIVEIYNSLFFKIFDTLGNDNEFKKFRIKLNMVWQQVQYEYFNWLHLRLYFMQIDLIHSYDKENFIDKEYVKEIKKIIEEE